MARKKLQKRTEVPIQAFKKLRKRPAARTTVTEEFVQTNQVEQLIWDNHEYRSAKKRLLSFEQVNSWQTWSSARWPARLKWTRFFASFAKIKRKRRPQAGNQETNGKWKNIEQASLQRQKNYVTILFKFGPLTDRAKELGISLCKSQAFVFVGQFAWSQKQLKKL